MPEPGVKMRMRVLPTLLGPSSTEYYLTRPAYAGGGKVLLNKVDLDQKVHGIQITESEGHNWKSRSRDFSGDMGGEFFTQRKFVEPDTSIPTYSIHVKDPPNSSGNTYHRTYKGPMTSFPEEFPRVVGPAQFPDSHQSSYDDLNVLGSQAVSRCKPTNSVADLSSALGEIYRDGLPSLIGHTTWKARTESARNAPRAAGGEFLNYQFGIVPTLNDIKDFVTGVYGMDKVLAQFERDAGKIVRRRYYFPREYTVTEENLPVSSAFWGAGISGSGFWFSNPGTLTRRREITTRTWFSGAFTYSLPQGMTSRTKLGELALKADRLGLDPSPETLWNIAPWSWAVDWFSNAGDVISNLEAQKRYGLVMRYGYIMQHTYVRETYTRSGTVLRDGKPISFPSTSLVTETKVRRKANPFGFGVKWDSLSPIQLAITAALGLSRT